ncbi:hypothetical protein ACHAPU_003091 [Fusarium lateritium]
MRCAIVLAVGATLVAAHPAAEHLDKRDTAECASVAQKILPDLNNAPTPSGSLESFLAKQTQLATMTDSCELPAVTGSLAKEYTSYASELSSWYMDQKNALSSLMDACSDVPEVQSQIDAVTKTGTICDKVTWASETGSASSKDDDNAAGSNSIKAGIVVAVAGVAGVMML